MFLSMVVMLWCLMIVLVVWLGWLVLVLVDVVGCKFWLMSIECVMDRVLMWVVGVLVVGMVVLF